MNLWRGTTFRERLMLRVSTKDNGCWEWLRRTDRDGYGRASGKLAHRVFYETFVGPIPDGLTIDHLCLNKKCCNPVHLEAVPPIINHRRYLQRFGRHNPFSLNACGLPNHLQGENLRISPGGLKRCRACNRIAVSKYAKRRKERAQS